LKEQYSIEFSNSLQEHIGLIENKYQKQKQKELDEIVRNYGNKHVERMQQLQKLEEQLKDHEQLFDRLQSNQRLIHQTHRLKEELHLLTESVQQGKPFTKELDTLLIDSEGQDLIKETLESLPKDIQHKGIPTTEQLRIDFKKLVPEARRIQLVSQNKDKSWSHVFTSVIKNQTSGEKSLITGDVFARVEFYLERGNVESALRELNELKGSQTEDFLNSWIKQANQYVVTQQTLDILNAHISLIQKSATL